MTKEEADLIIAEQNKSRDEILKAIEQEKCELLGIIQGKDKVIKDLEWQLQEMVEDNDYYQEENEKFEKENEVLKSRNAQLKSRNAELKEKWLQATDEGTSWAHLKSLEKEIAKYKEMVEDMKADMCSTKSKVLCNYLIGILKKYGEIV
ncbi:MAG: hypothetical protein J6S85_01580 [Methanobrevibacter sp.]|nr:hypothetical protein [Methanobrevibacter sp.]